MGLFELLFGPRLFQAKDKTEVRQLVEELIKIGIKEDFLSENPGSGYNHQCRHIRTREIGKRLSELGGLPLMIWAKEKVKKNAGKVPSSHLEYAWEDIGEWIP